MKIRILIALYCVFFHALPVWAAGTHYIANNILVIIEGPTTSATRDQALLQAQKIALAQFVSVSDASQVERAKTISDSALSRTMKDFSLQNERVLSQSYQASFMIRFDAMRFDGLLRSYNLPVPPVREIDMHNMRVEETAATQTPAAAGDNPDDTAVDGTVAAAPVTKRIVVLPVLNIGTRIIVWDEANAWRDAWQKKSSFPVQSQFSLPLGDIEDLHDAPDTGFIKKTDQAQPGLDNMLKRYDAQTVYIAWARAKQTPNQLSVKLYRYQDQKLTYQGEVNATSRPGYLFDDAVTATATQIDRIQTGQATAATPATAKPVAQQTVLRLPAETAAAVPATPSPVAAARAGSITATIPLANMTAWISLQQQLRRAPLVANLVTNSISANQAIVRIDSNASAAQLVQSLQASGFTLQQTGANRYTLYKNR